MIENPSFLESPRILFGIIDSMKRFGFNKEERRETENAVNDNSYAAHPESVLLSMLTDKYNKVLRKKAAKTILAIRKHYRENPPKRIRKFVCPKVSWSDVNAYDQFIPSLTDLKNLTEPPATMEPFADDQKILAIAENPDLYDLAGVLGHTQAVEYQIGHGTIISAHYAPSDPLKRGASTTGSNRRSPTPWPPRSTCRERTSPSRTTDPTGSRLTPSILRTSPDHVSLESMLACYDTFIAASAALFVAH